MDVDRFYVMLYYGDTKQVMFPSVWDGKKNLELSWAERALDNRWLSDQAVLQNEPVRLEGESQYWPEGEEIPKSWLAMPISIEENLRMALVVENRRRGDAFGDEAERFLTTIAQQAAMAIRNVRLLEEWQEAEKKRRAAEKFFAVNRVAGEFAHSMNNIAGTVPVWIKLARANLDPRDQKQGMVLQQLDEIDKVTQRLLRKAREIKEATQQRAREPVEINTIVESAIKRALASQPHIDERILVEKELETNLPKIEVERDSFIDTLTSIVKNGLESMSDRGTLRVSTCRSQEAGKPIIEIVISDSGVGISEENLKYIFDPFFTTKETGMGFGLWRDKTIIEELGGRIDVQSELSKGTTFTIKLPVK